jgi:uncharacterized repeat protein (TIGR03803 family)
MPSERRFAHFVAILTQVSVAVLLAASALAAPQYKVLHAFGGGSDGAGLYGGVAFDRQGRLYGTTSGGGLYEYGTVWQLTPQADGTWSERVLRSFRVNDPRGDEPQGGLLVDSLGNLYGTAIFGGAHAGGTVFKFSPSPVGWQESVLYNFCSRSGCKDGGAPWAGVIMDSAGNLYGTAGVVFELSPGANGWKEKALHSFTCGTNDGCGPIAGLVRDESGNLYGTTMHGGTSTRCGGGCGTAYQLQSTSSGWKEHILRDFGAIGDGAFPGVGALALDSVGSLYGTTTVGGAKGNGTVFRLTPQSNGHWKEILLHSFVEFANGQEPGAGVVMDKSGNLYGTTIAGGTKSCGCGVVYKLAPGPRGKWTYTVLHRFTGFDGAQPDANLILDSKGKLYGTTVTGGSGGAGVAFEITP